MEKASSTSIPDNGKKKKQHSPYLGEFGFVGMQVVHDKVLGDTVGSGTRSAIFWLFLDRIQILKSKIDYVLTSHIDELK